MSNTEAHHGRLVPMVLAGETIEERAKLACKQFNWKKGTHKTWLACLQDNGYRKVFVRDSVIYEIRDRELDPCGFSCVTANKDGSVDYILLYYNGRTCFYEALERAVNHELDGD